MSVLRSKRLTVHPTLLGLIVLTSLACGNTSVTQNGVPAAGSGGSVAGSAGAVGGAPTGSGGSAGASVAGGATSAGGKGMGAGGSSAGLGGTGTGAGGSSAGPGGSGTGAGGSATAGGAGGAGVAGATSSGGTTGIPAPCGPMHGPVAMAPVQLTTDLSDKRSLVASYGKGKYMLAWVGNPTGGPILQYAVADGTGKLTSPVQTLVDDAKMVPAATNPALAIGYDASKGDFGVGWAVPPNLSYITFISPEGAIELTTPLKMPTTWEIIVSPRLLAWNNGSYMYCGNSPTSADNFCYGISSIDTVSPASLNYYSIDQVVPKDDGFLVLGGTNLRQLDTSATLVAGSEAAYTLKDASGSSFYVWDGTAVVVISNKATGAGLDYERISLGGASFFQASITNASMTPVAALYVPDPNDPTNGKTAILASNGGSLFLVVRNKDGSKWVDAALVGGAADMQNPHLFWDGDNYNVFWTASASGIRQIFTTKVVCQ